MIAREPLVEEGRNGMTKNLPNARRSPWRQLALVFALVILAIVWRFHPWMPSVFFGDDLQYLLLFEDGQCATRLGDILTAVCSERFRPVASSFIIALMAVANHDTTYFLAANVVLHALVALMVYVISLRLSGGRRLVALGLALAVAMSRFAAFQVTQMIGPVESVTLLAILITVYASLRTDTTAAGAWRWAWVAIAAAFVSIHTHERSMVLAPWLALVFVTSPGLRALPRRRWLALLASCIALPVFYIGYKSLVLHTAFLIGTGGTHIGLDWTTIFEYLRQASLSLLGFNAGPDYLVGTSVTLAWRAAWLTALAFSTAWMGTITIRVRAAAVDAGSLASGWTRTRWLLLLLLLAGFLLAPAVITIRLEQRWLLAPFVVGLLAVAWAVGALPGKDSRKTTILTLSLAVVASVASIALDTLIMRHYDRLFFVSSPRFAELVKRDIVDRSAPGQAGDIALLAGADQCNWTLSGGGFFRIYGGKARTLHCLATLDEARQANLPAGTRIYGLNAQSHLADLTDQVPSMLRASLANARIDFIKSFDQGIISDSSHVSTPTGRGALLLPWISDQGNQQTLTVVSGFIYRYTVTIKAGDVLWFGAGMIYPAVQRARAIVRVETAGAPPAILYSQDLLPPAADARPSFIDVSVPLKDYAGQRVTIGFAVESPGGNAAGHWIGFVTPHIASSREPR
jgi:hypothetical protein